MRHQRCDRQGLTALHSAAEHGWNDTVKVLVADGADLQPKDSKGPDARSTMRRAAIHGRSWSPSIPNETRWPC